MSDAAKADMDLLEFVTAGLPQFRASKIKI